METKTDEGKAFKIHFMKEPNYAMKLMVSWIMLNNLEGAKNKRGWKENGFWKSE